VNEVSVDQFVKACVTFQQAKAILGQHLNGADVVACDTISSAVYKLANKAVSHQMRTHGNTISQVKRGDRIPFPQAIAQAVRNKPTFDTQTVIDAMKRRGTLPRAENIKAYVSSTLSGHAELFVRVERGVYRLKKRRLVWAVKKEPKALPEKTA
jgi:hypothetical protein